MVSTADTVEGRQTMPAGHVIVVVLICLALATFLNASSLERTAKRQSLGWKRDVLVALIKPVRAVGRATGVDATHNALRAALGPNTGGEPAGPLFEPARTPASHAPAAGDHADTGPPAQRPANGLPVRTWVIGDSLAGDVGPPLFDIGRDTVTGWLDFRIGTGLSRPDLFDWPRYIRSGAAELEPRALVSVFGGNDDKD